MRRLRRLSDPSVVLVTAAVADHRQAVLEVLMERLGPGFTAYAGDAYREHTLITLASIRPALRPLRNHPLAGGRLLWQHGVLQVGLQPCVLIADFNPRVLSTWGLLVIRRTLGMRTLLWGHAWPQAGREARIAFGRRLMRSLASAVIVYSAAEATALATELPSGRIFVAPNALYRERAITPVTSDPESLTDFVFVGRLIPARRPHVLLDAFARARDRLPAGARLVFVGDGPLRASLEAEAAPLGSAVTFLGRVSDEAVLREVYATAIASVHPGEVGLSATQSLGIGVPLVFSRAERLRPTIDAAEVGWNALAFEPADPRGLELALVTIAAERADWAARREAISARCRAEVSAEAGADAILRSCGLVA